MRNVCQQMVHAIKSLEGHLFCHPSLGKTPPYPFALLEQRIFKGRWKIAQEIH